MSTTLTINDQKVTVDAELDTPLLWAIRDYAGLTGTKYGCGVGQCGACTVHLDGVAVRSCSIPLAAVADKKITTIEGLNSSIGKAVQATWEQRAVPQCGYCQSGQVMSATALLENNPHPTDAQIEQAMSGNICRCGTYQRIKIAIHEVASTLSDE